MEKKISGETYRCAPLPASQAIELYADLARIATLASGRLPAIIASLALKAGEDDAAAQIADMQAIAALGDILQRNTSSDIRALVERIVSAAEIKRPSGYDAVNLDDDFTGRLASLLPVIRLVLEVNFADFFPASAGSGPLSRLRAALVRTKSAA